MEVTVKSPRITHFEWGILQVEGYPTAFKDAKLYPGGAQEWDWSETGTRHEPGIQPADLQTLLDHQVSVVVLSKGVHERLQVCPETLQLLVQHGIETHVLQTEKAIEKYNELAQHNAVGALIHSTC
jgi:hypothetical protein